MATAQQKQRARRAARGSVATDFSPVTTPIVPTVPSVGGTLLLGALDDKLEAGPSGIRSAQNIIEEHGTPEDARHGFDPIGIPIREYTPARDAHVRYGVILPGQPDTKYYPTEPATGDVYLSMIEAGAVGDGNVLDVGAWTGSTPGSTPGNQGGGQPTEVGQHVFNIHLRNTLRKKGRGRFGTTLLYPQDEEDYLGL